MQRLPHHLASLVISRLCLSPWSLQRLGHCFHHLVFPRFYCRWGIPPNVSWSLLFLRAQWLTFIISLAIRTTVRKFQYFEALCPILFQRLVARINLVQPTLHPMRKTSHRTISRFQKNSTAQTSLPKDFSTSSSCRYIGCHRSNTVDFVFFIQIN